jgi:thiol:disulfide interchange protein DsbC
MKHTLGLISMGLLLAAVGVALPASQQLTANSKADATVGAPLLAAPDAAPNTVAVAAPTDSAAAQVQAVSPETLKRVAAVAGEGVRPEDVRATPIAGLFELRRGSEIIYMSQDGRYVLTGDLYRAADRSNLTEAHRAELRRQLIDAMPESKMVIFSPPEPKYTVTVFTDVDCPYCQALHKQIAEYNRLGIRVRYLFFPRSGPKTPSWYKAEQVWCSADRKAALTDAKLGKPLQAQVCPDTPVAQEYELGKQVGLEGTPGIIASNGTIIGGYMPPDELLKELKQLNP